MAEEGQAIPEPSSLDVIFASDWDTAGAIPFLVAPTEPETRVVRVNVTFKPKVLEVLDGYAAETGLSRSGALEQAVGAWAQLVASPRRGRVSSATTVTRDGRTRDRDSEKKPARVRRASKARARR